MLKYRCITAAILIPVVVYTVLFLETIWFGLLMAVFVSLAAWEWAGLSGYPNRSCIFYQAVVVISLGVAYQLSNAILVHVLVSAGIIWWGCGFVLVILYQKGWNVIPSKKFIKAGIGMLILVPAWVSIVALHARLPDGVDMVLFLLILIWVADSAAYMAGSRWGKRKLASNVSPGKTWEGTGSAFIASIGVGLGYALLSGIQGINILFFLCVCLVTVLFSVLGDLVESLFKRLAEKKDSGHLLPGHGGVMDRLDSLTAASPVFLAGVWVLEGKI
ncbi:MAG: phosphatidate cytidylyltransferase [Gammaproteobacteria bacterium]